MGKLLPGIKCTQILIGYTKIKIHCAKTLQNYLLYTIFLMYKDFSQKKNISEVCILYNLY